MPERASLQEAEMRVGVPQEIKANANRVGLVPACVRELTARGHEVVVETGAGLGAGLTDEQYLAAGATLAPDAATVFASADMIVKVKEPQPAECAMLRPDQVLFTYLHLAADPVQTAGLQKSGCIAIAYETITDASGRLPLLAPMSEVAGRMAVQAGARCLEHSAGGSGILLGGVPGVEPANVLVLGGGIVGSNAARVAAGLGANVVIMDVNLSTLRALDNVMPPNVTGIYSDPHAINEYLERADLVIGAVLLPGRAAPKLVSRQQISRMKAGSVIVDVCIDQGGCLETSRPTTHSQPTFIVDDVVHYCVANMPSAVGRTSTQALCNATLPYVRRLAALGPKKFLELSPGHAACLNLADGKIRNADVAAAFEDLPRD
jgi:alanine dehydrogenase